MIKSNTIIDPTQSPVVVVVSAVGEKISDVNGDVMTQQRQYQSGSGRCEHNGGWKEKLVPNQKSASTELEREPRWCERGKRVQRTMCWTLINKWFCGWRCLLFVIFKHSAAETRDETHSEEVTEHQIQKILWSQNPSLFWTDIKLLNAESCVWGCTTTIFQSSLSSTRNTFLNPFQWDILLFCNISSF